MITYASAERVVREALLTADDPKRAQLLRSFADATRTLSAAEELPSTAQTGAEPRRSLRLAIEENYPSPPRRVEVNIPIAGDDLDVAHARLPAGMHLTVWRR